MTIQAAVIHSDLPPLGATTEAPVTKRMLVAGRRAFIENRANLSDLYDFYECDLTATLKAIYRSMAGAM
jgi:hypothetical protein